MKLLATTGPTAYWYMARGTGAVALLLLTASVVLGVLGSVRFSVGPRWPRFAVDALHRDVSLLVLVVLVVHIATSVLDKFAPITLADAVIPFASSYRPLWLGLGALSFDLLLALTVTSLLRRRLGYRVWRAVHWLAYASWPVAVLHGLGTGSDVKATWMLGLTAACVAAVVVAVWVRIARAESEHPARAAAVALSVVTPLALVVFTLAGPLRPGWARRAGTPARLLPKAYVVAASPTAATSRSGAQSAPGGDVVAHRTFSASLAGTAIQTPAPGGEIVELALRVRGGALGNLRIRMGGQPLQSGGLEMTGSQVDLSLAGASSVLQGQIVSLAGQRILARVTDASGAKLSLRADVQIDSQSGAVTGTLTGAPAGSGGGGA
jgi:ferric reductase like protein